ncbi:MAG: hypothetical protein JO244_06180 [Solirubrobacterales bacterium]|nr:hypothetical protein [Solirubrobacterales bacterium]
MFHIELRQFPHVARAFNLTADELHSRVVSRWTAGQLIELEDRRWSPDRAKLTIYQARQLAGDEIGMGRGWGTVSQVGEDVTQELLVAAKVQDEAPGALAEVKAQLLAALSGGPLTLSQVVELTGDPTWRASERLRLAEQAVWELLHEQRVSLEQAGAEVTRDRWQPVVLSWGSWAAGGAVAVRLA